MTIYTYRKTGSGDKWLVQEVDEEKKSRKKKQKKLGSISSCEWSKVAGCKGGEMHIQIACTKLKSKFIE